ncbi:MAG: hypothetical protein H7145_06610 [Akkermansiaceae bacterium]|nr:hypothetical protein [Armatimonadota bacterium]
MNSFSKTVIPFACAVCVVVGVLSLPMGSLAQEKVQPRQKSDRERIAALEAAVKADTEQSKSAAAFQQRVTRLEQRNAQLEQKIQQYQQDLANTHQRDISNLNQQIMQLDQQVRTRRM